MKFFFPLCPLTIQIRSISQNRYRNREGLMRKSIVLVSTVFALLCATSPAHADRRSALERIRAVKREGAGNESAAAAVRELSRLDAQAIPEILAAMDGADIVAINWLRSVVEAIAEREVAAGKSLPVGKLE